MRPERPSLKLLGLGLNAVFIGQTALAVPNAFVSRDLSNGQIVSFNVLLVSVAILANAALFAGRRRIGSGQIPLLLGSVLAATGAILLATTAPPLVAAPFIACSSVVFPLTVSQVSRSPDPGAMARARQFFIVGYVIGLLSVSGLALTGLSIASLGVAAAVQFLSLIASALSGNHERSVTTDVPATGDRATSSAAPIKVIVLAAAAVFFMRSGDAIRQSYLPLYIHHIGLPSGTSSLLMALTAVIEIAVLPLIAYWAHGRPGQGVLTITTVVGCVSFLLLATQSHSWALVSSQVLYAFFVAGYQSLGIVWMQRLLPDSSSGGAALYTVAVQSGSVLGLVSALASPNFSANLFLFAACFVAVAAASVLLGSAFSRREVSQE